MVAQAVLEVTIVAQASLRLPNVRITGAYYGNDFRDSYFYPLTACVLLSALSQFISHVLSVPGNSVHHTHPQISTLGLSSVSHFKSSQLQASADWKSLAVSGLTDNFT